MTRRHHNPRAGLSLLEVLVALAIFMLSVVVISQMVDSAARTAQRSQRLTKAALRAESKMSELLAGIEPVAPIGLTPLDDPEPGWFYEILVEPEQWSTVPVEGQAVVGLYTVHVRIVWQSSQTGEEVEYLLTRIMLDPALRVPAPTPPSPSSTPTGTAGGTNANQGPPATPTPTPTPSPTPTPGGGPRGPGGRP